MASTISLHRFGAEQMRSASRLSRTVQRPTARTNRHALQIKPFSRHASTTSTPAESQYHISKRAVHIGVPLLAATYLVLRFTDPSSAPQPPQKLMEGFQGTCKKIHASDLNKYIKSHPDEISDEHTVGWNKMYNSFKEDRRNESEPARIEEENARQLAQYARIEENKDRSTKIPGVMATEGGNRNITHRPELTDEAEATAKTFSERISARVEEAKRRFTKVTKGRDFS